jgi:hypothetical protein
VNFGPQWQKLASRQIETYAEVLLRLRHLPRSLLGLRRVESVCRAGQCLANSPSHYSLTAGRIRFGFRAKRSEMVGSSKFVNARPRRPPLDSDHARCEGVAYQCNSKLVTKIRPTRIDTSVNVAYLGNDLSYRDKTSGLCSIHALYRMPLSESRNSNRFRAISGQSKNFDRNYLANGVF